jgi:hypothetical protein
VQEDANDGFAPPNLRMRTTCWGRLAPVAFEIRPLGIDSNLPFSEAPEAVKKFYRERYVAEWKKAGRP